MLIRGKEVDFKISRKSDAEKMENALQKMAKTEVELTKMGDTITLSNLLQAFLDMLSLFFIDATGVDVLEDCEDVEEAQEVYRLFLEEVKKQKGSLLGITLQDIK